MAGSFSYEFALGDSFDTFYVDILTTSLPDTNVNSLYDQTLQADVDVTWSVISGVLPSGLSLNGVTGTIKGTSTVAGVYNFTVEAAYGGPGYETDTQAYSIGVSGDINIAGWREQGGSVFSTMLRRYIGFKW